MKVINTFLVQFLFFMFLIIALMILVMGSVFVLGVLVQEWFGFKVDFTKRGYKWQEKKKKCG